MRVASSMLVLAAAMALPVGARAADADTMRVTGAITANNACAMSIQNGGNIEYGVIPTSTLNQLSDTNLAMRPLAVSINCSTPTYIALSIHDMRTGGDGNRQFGLGYARPEEPTGYYQVTHAQAVSVNGTTGHMLNEPEPGPIIGANWNSAYHVDPWYNVSEWRSFGYQTTGAAEAISTAQFTLHIRATIRRLDVLAPTGAIHFDGQFMMEMMYM